MKISVNWIKQFTTVDLSVDELVQKIGAQLGAVEEVIDIGQKYQGIIVAKVVTCEKHPNADKLSVCMIDDGGRAQNVDRNDKGLVQVVCGAPNVRAGLTVAWLPPGSTVPSTFDRDPFVLGARELRGVMSNGMLASSAELAISDDHSGIVEIDTDVEPGSSFAEVYELNDFVIDIENKMFTHRPDCFGVLGVAREIAGIQGLAFNSPDWYTQGLGRIKPGDRKLSLEVRNEVPELVPRFMMVAMSGVEVKPSPMIMQTYLSRVGLRPINNIVDVTNYLMVLTGQPLHAFDYDKVARQDGAQTATVVVRKPEKGETVALLNGKTIEPHQDAIMIASDSKLIGVAGVMGGAETEVDESTKNIILECANFDMYSVRRTSMMHGLFTDAVTRFNKGQSPLQNEQVLEEAIETMHYVSGGQVASEVVDIRHGIAEPSAVQLSSDFVNGRLGLQLSAEEMANVLRSVEFQVDLHHSSLTVVPPFWRTDIHIREDVVEEIGRLVGFDKLPVELPKRFISPTPRNQMLDFKAKLRDQLARAGANEVLSYSFVHGDLLSKSGQDPDKAFRISNALSPDLQYYRQSLLPGLLDKVHANLKAGFDEFAIFEIGKTHLKGVQDNEEPEVPAEFERVALVVAANEKTASQYNGAAYYQAKAYVLHLLAMLGLKEDVSYKVLVQEDQKDEEHSMIAVYEPKRAARLLIGDSVIGSIGEFAAPVRKGLKLPSFCAGFELDLVALLRLSDRASRYQALSRYPKVEQDISLKIPYNLAHGELFNFIKDKVSEHKPEGSYFRLSTTDIYQRKKDSEHKQTTLRLVIASYERTLTADEINALLDRVAAEAQAQFGAERL